MAAREPAAAPLLGTLWFAGSRGSIHSRITAFGSSAGGDDAASMST